MSPLPFYYSIVVDAQPTHPYQAQLLLFTLELFGRVPRTRIIVQCTTRVPAAIRDAFLGNGYIVTEIAPYLDETYCNKIAQLDYFIQADLSETAGIFLLDLDMVVLSPLDVSDRRVVWGKVVNKPLPRLSTLERIFSAAEVPFPDTVPCDWDLADTFTTNFNGGVLYVPCSFLARVRASWRRQGEFLFAHPGLFDSPDQRRNIDQIAFALTLATEEVPYRHLTANWNFSCNNSQQQSRTYEPALPIHVLHYHQCLDKWGLVAPNFSDPTVGIAVERVNRALIQQNDRTFFDIYKKHRAKQVVVSVPSIRTPLFSKNFLARTLCSGKPRRFILHAGTPKTGTSSLQWYLYSQRDSLAEAGIWYPPPTFLRKGASPKHQPLSRSLLVADPEAFSGYIEHALRDMPGSIHTIIMTTEDVYAQWRDYSPRAKSWLRHLVDLFDFKICVWFREPASFAASFYGQVLSNPGTKNQKNIAGRDIGFDAAMREDWFLGQLDFLGFYYEAQEMFGVERITPFLYSGETVRTFCTHYALGQQHPVQAAEAPHRANSGLSTLGVRLMRFVNRWRWSLPQAQREPVQRWVRRSDRIIGGMSPAFRLSERQAALVNRYAGRGWAVLQEECRKSAASRRVAR